MEMSCKFTTSPAALHRIPVDVRKHSQQESLASKSQLSKYLEKCVTSGAIYEVPDITVVEGYVSRYGNAFCEDGIKGAMGISTFAPFDDSTDAFKAAHDLHNIDGTRLRCYVFPKDHAIEGQKFLYDRNINTCLPTARHVLIYPSSETTTTPERFNSIATCQYPENVWQMCSYCAASEEYDEPCFPNDPLFRIALSALENVALDTELPGNVRMHGRLYQYCIGDIQWSDLAFATDFCFLAMLLYALLKLFPKISNAHDLATIRGALRDLSYWLSKLGDTSDEKMQNMDSQCGELSLQESDEQTARETISICKE